MSAQEESPAAPALERTALYAIHVAAGARMVPFAGFAMPLQYPSGIIAEHLHTRRAAGLFDVSHMGQLALRARSGSTRDAALALEMLVPADLLGLAAGRQRYALLTNHAGGIRDDLMVTRMEDRLLLVVNAACRASDLGHLRAHLEPSCTLDPLSDRALLALQGPAAESVLAGLAPASAQLRFMQAGEFSLLGTQAVISRSGYTGEDGFEISIPGAGAEALAGALLKDARVQWAGLGARDTLRLEAGLCLFGSDLDATTTPVEAALEWSIQKSRRPGGARAGGFPGAETVFRQLAAGPPSRRVGLKPEGRAPVRSGAELFAAAEGNSPVGRVTSGGFGPSVNAPVAMGYVRPEHAAPATRLFAEQRGRRLAVSVAPLPFVPPGFKRG